MGSKPEEVGEGQAGLHWGRDGWQFTSLSSPCLGHKSRVLFPAFSQLDVVMRLNPNQQNEQETSAREEEQRLWKDGR